MAGYHEFSKSNNALQAESRGSFPASILARRLKVKTGAIKDLMTSSEWHHTSCHYNMTDYYDGDTALEIIDQLRAWKSPVAKEALFENCSGVYLIWGGTRKHPVATETTFKGVTARLKGKWFTLNLPSGMVRKASTTRGFKLFDKHGKPLVNNY
jgi:hypothetical protein